MDEERRDPAPSEPAPPATNGHAPPHGVDDDAAEAMLHEALARRTANLGLEEARRPVRLRGAHHMLLSIANVERRDVVVHADRSRYSTIGIFLCLYMLYATGAVVAFLAGIGVGHGGVGPVALLLIAILVGGGIVMYDRVIVGTSNANLAASAAGLDGSDDAGAIQRAILSPLGGLRPGMLLVRVLIALLMASFVTQALDDRLFNHQIVAQLGTIHEVTLVAQLRDPTGPLARAKADLQDLQRQKAGYQGTENGLLRKAAGFYRQATNSKLGLDPSGLRGCGSICQGGVGNYNRYLRLADQARTQDRAAIARLTKEIQHQHGVIDGLPGVLKKGIDRDKGGITDTKALIDYVGSHPETWFQFLAVTIMLLLFDLAAVVLKVGGRNSVYEHRQALRQQRLWHDGVVGALRARLDQASAMRADRRSFEAASAALNDALQRARRNRAVTDQADRIAVGSVLSYLHNEAPPKQGPPRRQEPGGAAPGEDGQRQQPPAGDEGRDGGSPAGGRDPGGRRAPEPREIPQRVGVLRRRIDSVPLEPGRQFTGRYRWRLVRRLRDQGAQSVTWLAEPVGEDLPQAVIKLLTLPADRDGRRSQAMRELRNLNRLRDSAYAVQIIDQGTDPRDDVIWFATEYYERGSLNTYYGVHDRRERPLREVLAVACQIVDGLREAADERLLHRDLKPGNVLVRDVVTSDSPRPFEMPLILIADWGMSYITDYVEKILHRRPGGTLWYAAPQAFRRGEGADVRDDLYSLGTIIWWLCTGAPPHYHELGPRTSAGELDRAIAERERQGHLQLLDDWLDVPLELSNFVARLLRYARDDRVPAEERDVWEWAERALVEIYEQVEEMVLADGRERMVGPGAAHDRRAGGLVTLGEEAPPERPMAAEGPWPIEIPRRLILGPGGTAPDAGAGTDDDDPPEPDAGVGAQGPGPAPTTDDDGPQPPPTDDDTAA